MSRLPVRSVAACLVLAQIGLLAWSASRHSATYDEAGFLAAGIAHWTFARFDAYRVNPPLVRLVATAPVILSRPEVDWTGFSSGPIARPEFYIGHRFTLDQGPRAFRFIRMARWACIPFSLLGAWICYPWARELYGPGAGLVALALWCFSPNILAHGQLITADVGATALGAAAAYWFWRWLSRPTWQGALAAGLVLGLAELAKFTLVIFFPLWVILWVVWRLGGMTSARAGMGASGHAEASDAMAAPGRNRAGRRATDPPGNPGPYTDGQPEGAAGQARPLRAWVSGAQLAGIFLVAVYVINAGYGFEGSLKPLGNYPFASRLFAGPPDAAGGRGVVGNRFAGTWLGRIPVPLPENDLRGMDRQRLDFENRMWSFLRGEWRFGDGGTTICTGWRSKSRWGPGWWRSWRCWWGYSAAGTRGGCGMN
ncbi:MAG: ArnT family glycosyltransferase [Thermoguttaceae bacterium]